MKTRKTLDIILSVLTGTILAVSGVIGFAAYHNASPATHAVINWTVAHTVSYQSRDYIYHPRMVARTLERQLTRDYASIDATVQGGCWRTSSKLRDECQMSVYPANSTDSVVKAGTAVIAKDGGSFRMVWDVGTASYQRPARPARPATVYDVVEIGHPSINVAREKPPFLNQIIAAITVRTVIEPEQFFMHVTLWRLINPAGDRGRGTWKQVGAYSWTKTDLPAVGERERLAHEVAGCEYSGRYYTRWDVYTKSDTGQHERVREYWPYLNWNSKNHKKHRPDPQRPPTILQSRKINCNQ